MFEYLKHCKAPKSMTKIKSEFDMALCITKRPLKKKHLIALANKFDFKEDFTADLAGLSKISFKNMNPDSPLSEIANEIVIKLAELFESGLTTFDGRSSFIIWLNANVGALNNYKPIQIIGSYTGITIVRDLLIRMEYSILC